MAEQAALVGRRERRAARQLERAADVVDERGGDQRGRCGAAGGAAPSRGRASRRRPCARAARPRRSGGRPASRDTRRRSQPARTARTVAASPGCVISPTRNSRKPCELLGVAPRARASGSPGRRRVASSVRTSSWSRSRKRSTRPSTRTASPSPKRPSSSSTSFQTRASIRPVESTSSSARYGAPPFVRSLRFVLTAKTPSTTRSSASSAMSPGRVYGPARPARSVAPRMPCSTVSRAPVRRRGGRPARAARRSAVRRDRRRASAREYLARSPYNVVHLTLPDSRGGRGARPRRLARARACSREEEPALWWIAQDYVGPDGVARTREGIAGSIEATPYSGGRGAAARADARGAEGGPAAAPARDADAARADLPALRRRPAARAARRRAGSSTSRRAASGRASGGCPPRELELDAPLLIADGHHRYETAVAFREEDPTATHTFAVLVSSRSPGRRDLPDAPDRAALAAEPRAGPIAGLGRSGLALYRDGASTSASTPTTSSTRAPSSGSRREGVALHAVRRRGASPPSTAARPRPRSSSARRRSSRSRPSRPAARRCRRSRRSSIPKLTSGPPLPPAVTEPWLELCRAAVADVQGVLAELPGRDERERADRRRRGRRRHDGDRRGRRERVILAHFERDDRRIVSRGDRRSAARAATRVSSTRSTARRTPSAGSRTSRSRSRWPRATRSTTSSSATSTTSARRGVDGGARRRRVPRRASR